MKKYLSLVKFSHTIFALPFALIGYFLAVTETGSGFDPKKFILVLACMVFARSAAMAFNRYIDRKFDKLNPRTAVREIPAGVISEKNALIFVILSSAAFTACCWFINPLCFYLAPVALTVVLGYSYTKRFTPLCHLVLGVGLSFAPVGAYAAVTGYFTLLPWLFSGIVLTWVSGFDIVYALQDEEFDRANGLHSIPETFGKAGALRLSESLHAICAGLLIFTGFYGNFGYLYILATILFIAMLIWQHRLVKPNDLSRVDMAFFTANGVASLVFGLLVTGDLYF